MIFNTLVTTTAAIAALASSVSAVIAPSYPSPGTVWTAGKEYTITWKDDGQKPDLQTAWTNFKIDFMTGDNLNQTVLTNVASGLDATKISSYKWTAPQVDPYSAVYFFMFTNDKGDSAWTTRFGIVAKDGDSLVPESEKTQPDGSDIPWGNGQLAGDASSSNNASDAASSSAAPASSSVAAASSSAAPASSSAASAASESASSSPSASSGASESSSSKDDKTAAQKDDATNDESGVAALRAPVVQAGLFILAAAAYTLA
ncbi:hypothetical protein RO3G_01770 [Lichtheimia corymbifera JMRC:FSU:9682]|uniref:Yeast cell wall synthesis Kre9/Knh1-like N-terminal domain-containing protein n=1 Tax=Lichtheimia corymbifera JMRC:FSU:9682 TaxID=1263082 RepID=A0A068RH48_9FUNG|nr:hypothetical protein RO3G_01770 [Lichtheimia corymbifera JMRC:FSU:9682]